jgi:hypothetical protein
MSVCSYTIAAMESPLSVTARGKRADYPFDGKDWNSVDTSASIVDRGGWAHQTPITVNNPIPVTTRFAIQKDVKTLSRVTLCITVWGGTSYQFIFNDVPLR